MNFHSHEKKLNYTLTYIGSANQGTTVPCRLSYLLNFNPKDILLISDLY